MKPEKSFGTSIQGKRKEDNLTEVIIKLLGEQFMTSNR